MKILHQKEKLRNYYGNLLKTKSDKYYFITAIYGIVLLLQL